MSTPATATAPSGPLRDAGLRYSTDARRGYTRRMQRGRFVYLDQRGRRVTDAAELARIAALAIPPAYTDVWICSDACGRLQATGRDARGRKQYRYHPDWRTLRDAGKYQRMAAFGAALARMRARVERDLRAPKYWRPLSRCWTPP
jgi:DNA topoisomerase-1